MSKEITPATPRIKKVLVIRIPAENGSLIDRSEFLLDETSITLAKAGLENYFRIISAADALVAKGKTPADHYPQSFRCHVPELENEENVEVWDACLRPDFWFSREEILLERIFIKIVR